MIKKILFQIVIALSVFFLFPHAVSGVEPVIIGDDISRLPVGTHLEILEDKEKKWTINDVTKDYVSEKFIKSNKKSPGYGFSDSAYWVRFKLQKDSGKNQDLLLELDFPLMDKISLFIPQTDGRYLEKKYGYSMPFSQRDIQHRNFVFKLSLSKGDIKTYYFRFESAARVEIPLTIWSITSFQEKDHVDQFILGIFYGILLVMALYNFLLFVSIRDNSFLYYVIFIVAYAFFQLSQNGLAHEFIFPDSLSNHYVHIIDAVMLVSIIQFAQSFLNTKLNTRRLDKALSVLKISFPIIIIVSFFISYSSSIMIVNILIIASAVTGLFAGSVSAMKGYRPAKFFIIAWTLLITGAIIYIFKAFGILPNNYFTSYAVQVGAALEVILLSLGLGDRINLMKEENIEIQKEALAVQTGMAESFSRFVPKEFLKYLSRESIADVKLGDQTMKEMTILFSDIRSFTKISEKLTPQENIDFLNSYLISIGPVIRKNNGFIDKYIGDAIMALFPDSADDAVNAAIDMHRQLEEFNKLRILCQNDPIKIGIGIHTGDLMLGTIGEQNRIETTVISDSVNIASRLEGLNKKYDSGIIISNDVFLKLKDQKKYNFKNIGSVKIRGKDDPVSVTQVVVD